MFLGRYDHTIDEKGRLTIPVRYRELLVEGAFVTQGFDRNLMVLTPSAFDQVYAYINQISMTDPDARQLKRLIFSSAERVEVDKVGRILIPQYPARIRPVWRAMPSWLVRAITSRSGRPPSGTGRTKLLQNTEANEHRFAAFNLPTR